MANFEVQYRVGSEVESVVVSASDKVAAGKVFGSSHQGISADDVLSVRDIDYYPNYGVAKFICVLVAFGGWSVVVIGIVGVIAGALIAQQLYHDIQGFDPARQWFIAAALAGSWFSLVLVIVGLLMVALGQHLRATTDAANSLGGLLAFMKKNVATSRSEPSTRVPQQVSPAKFCSGCGAAAVEGGSAFCAQCGAKL